MLVLWSVPFLYVPRLRWNFPSDFVKELVSCLSHGDFACTDWKVLNPRSVSWNAVVDMAARRWKMVALENDGKSACFLFGL